MTEPIHRFPEFWTEADLDALPENGHRYEILHGGMHLSPPRNGRHQRTGQRLVLRLLSAAPEGWEVLQDLGIRVPGGIYVPDAVVLKPNADLDATWQDTENVALVVEVASPTTDLRDRTDKAAKYAEAGIPTYWRVARDGTITVHALVDEAQYGIVKPGETWTAVLPFSVELDPAALVV
ncbi:Uma2 family endonuclease [Pseudonocardia eucalypti]|uniref:Uma2 family endonuclease n=1 Tax=Pseudonocardia eucalypti TaxID=648755 RepID=A0ABP9RER6_9PSEU|nr:Uma2 family endonuclease [Pseudonocardia eucalypti]